MTATPVRFGQPERFAIDLVVDRALSEDFVLGRVRLWVGGKPFGDWDCITPLGVPIAAFERRAYSLPLCALLDGLDAQAAIALVEDRIFPTDPERDLGTLERDYFVFGPVLFDALLGEAFARQRVLLLGTDGAARLVATHAGVVADQTISLEELRATLLAAVEWGRAHAGFVAANPQQTLDRIS